MSTTARALSTRSIDQSSSAAQSRSAAEPRRFSWGGYARRGLATVVAAVLANSLFYYLGSALVTYDPEFIVLGNVSGAAIQEFMAKYPVANSPEPSGA